MFYFAETTVNLKSWAIVIFVLNLHVSCQTLYQLKEKKLRKTKTRGLAIILTQMYPLCRECVSKHARLLDHSGC